MNKENARQQGSQILFDLSKKEYCDPNEYKKLLRRLKQTYSVSTNKEELNYENLKDYQVLVLGCPREPFRKEEFEQLMQYINHGGSLLVMLAEGGEAKNGTNVNYLIEQFGISINGDSLLRTSYFKYFHPKEVYVSNGILNKEIVRAAKGIQKPSAKKDTEGRENKIAKKLMEMKDESKHDNSGLHFVYPFGSTLNVQKPSFPLLSSGPISYPMNRPLCATYVNPSNKREKVVVVGSVKMFDDEYIDKEDNGKLIVIHK
jgi:intraflagellar transport protein 52